MDKMFVSSPIDSHVKVLSPMWLCFKVRPVSKWYLNEVIKVDPSSGRAGALLRRGRDTRAPSLSFMWQQSKKAAHCKPGREPSPGTESAGTLLLQFPASGTLRKRCLLLFWQPELIKINRLVVVMCFQLLDISTKTSSPLKDMKTESWHRASLFMHKLVLMVVVWCIYSKEHQIKK